jgi:Tubulin-tyrosine ligase family
LAAQPTGASARSVVPTIAVIETLREARATSIRIALALARPQSARVLVCHWHSLNFSPSTVFVCDAFYRVTAQQQFECSAADEQRQVDALFFFGPDSGTLDTHDTPTLDKLCAAGIDAHGVPLYMVVDRMMLEASRRGVITNALGTSRAWGPKHNQELKLRGYEKATGHTVVRPETYIARPHELRAVLSRFAARSESCFVKPLFGEGGLGLHIVRPGESAPQCDRTVVVQRLIPDPLLVEGRKADLRWYLLIDENNRLLSKRLLPVFVRRASVTYLAGNEAAEITNTHYRLRHGLKPDMFPLAPMPDISPDLFGEITAQLDSLASRLLDAYFWDAALAPVVEAEPAKRLIILGIDALVALPAQSKPCVYFLETNPFPAFFRGMQTCDAAMEEMLAIEYLPALLRAWQS